MSHNAGWRRKYRDEACREERGTKNQHVRNDAGAGHPPHPCGEFQADLKIHRWFPTTPLGAWWRRGRLFPPPPPDRDGNDEHHEGNQDG